MTTLKFKYSLQNPEDMNAILQYMKEYTSCLHLMYNYLVNHKDEEMNLFSIAKKDSGLNAHLRNCNNISKVRDDSWFRASCLGEAHALFQKSSKAIFGGKRMFFQRMKGNISKEDYRLNRISPVCSCGDKLHTRKFSLSDDLQSVMFKPVAKSKIQLNLVGVGHRKKILEKLYVNQTVRHDVPVTYHLSHEYVWITFDESILYANDFKVSPVEGRVMSIDMNPNYVGWSIVDWSGSTENDFKVIKSGVISIKKLNDKDKEFKGKHLAPDSKERTYISNKRIHETLEISKKLVSIALHYRCQLFAVEELSMKASDKGLGKSFNCLVNNMWCRNALVNNLRKRCNIFGIKLLEVKPEYSSFIGNFLFRILNLPDMVLASIEIGRRAFEFYNQYTTKKNKIQKNIVKPNLEDFNWFYSKSLEEFGMESSFKDLVELYYFFKKSKFMYRLSVDKFLTSSTVLRQFPRQSLVSHYNFYTNCNGFNETDT